MNTNPYINPALRATAQNLPDPAGLVGVWLNQLDTIRALDLSGKEIDPVICFDLLALAAKLRRSQSVLIEENEGCGEMDWVETFLKEKGDVIAANALRFPDAAGWLEDAEELDRMYDDFLAAPEAIRQQAEIVLTNLDDAELMLSAAWGLGQSNPELELALDDCRDWLTEHADLFYAAEVLAQALAMTFRPDLENVDYDLAWTAQKFQTLLDTAELIELENSNTWLPGDWQQQLAAFRARYKKEQIQRLSAAQLLRMWAFAKLVRSGALVAGPQKPPSLTTLRWQQPDGIGTAACIFSQSGESVTMRFYAADDKPLAVAAESDVSLDGVHPRNIDDGKAVFSISDLKKVEELELRLQVKGVEWEPIDDE